MRLPCKRDHGGFKPLHRLIHIDEPGPLRIFSGHQRRGKRGCADAGSAWICLNQVGCSGRPFVHNASGRLIGSRAFSWAFGLDGLTAPS